MKKTNRSFDDLINEIKVLSANPAPSNREKMESIFAEIGPHFTVVKEHLKLAESFFAKSPNVYPTVIFEEAELEADKFLKLIDTSFDFDFLTKMPAISPLVALALINKSDGEASKKVRANFQSEIAKRPRPGAKKTKERQMVLKYFNAWQTKKYLYKTETKFINDMIEKTGINRPETIRIWLKELKASQPVK